MKADKSGIHYILLTLVVGLVGGLTGSWLWSVFGPSPTKLALEYAPPVPGRLATNDPAGTGSLSGDFTLAAATAAPSVVFIKTLSNSQPQDDFWSMWDFFGRRGPVSSAGSGVIVSADGYIVTNNHVIDKADLIEVILQDKHTYRAKVVGTDPNTDLAVIKIEGKNLKPIKIGNSDDLRIGEWVVAVGNPLNLTSTITAGIVSAKGRNIHIVNTTFPIESFIQTDAAINPGNSGGALVNVRGELVGINTAIASQTGAYSGYGFAIPVRIVEKIIKDLADFGTVQRAFIGAEVIDIDDKVADKLPDDDFTGVLVDEVSRGSAAAEAGLQPGDVIIQVNRKDINSKAEYLERLSLARPGDQVALLIKRKGAPREVSVKATNSEGTTALLKNTSVFVQELGCNVSPISKVEREKLGVASGFRLSGLRPGTIQRLGIPENFVILKVNQQVPSSIDELANLINRRGRLIIEGMNPNGSRGVYQFYSY
jgi:Do/DeqQ family serine protease